MRWVVRIAIGLVVLVLGFFGLIYGASEMGSEIVTLTTHDADGGDSSTRLWVVDHAGFAWLRAGGPETGWLVRLTANPDVVVERAGRPQRFRAAPETNDAILRTEINRLMREKYPTADPLIDLMRSPDGVIPVRLEPVVPEPTT